MFLAKNKKALFDHEIIEKLTAGVVLRGYEVKAIKEGKVSFDGSYIDVRGGEAFVVNLYIGRYSRQSQKIDDMECRRPRKLLLGKHEVRFVASNVGQKGKTAVPLALHSNHGLVKLELAIVKGRKRHEKKLVKMERQFERDLQREVKGMQRF
ncbi:SsrA-binding protein SmpB [candidate division WWE3 bacterium]|nr:SsrA-binding protein SmpB [candidate division WWE3 bacterium]